MKRSSISGWNIFHESKPDAPPIVSVRILIPLSAFHQQDGMALVYINLVRNIISRESEAYSIAGTPFVSWGLNHITIGIHTLEEDLRDFLILVQASLRIVPTQKEIDEELLQQKKLDQWNATQPRELLYSTLYEQYFGKEHGLCFDIDGTWRQRSSIDQDRIKEVVAHSWPTSIVIVSRLDWGKVVSILEQTLEPTKNIPCGSYQTPKPNWNNYAIPCSQSDQVGLMLTCPTHIMGDQQEYTTELGLMCLAGMFHSRMNQKLRLNDGSTYGVDCHYIRNQYWGRVEISCFVHENQAFIAWEKIQRVWSDANRSWTQEELDKTRTILIRNERLREETCAQACSVRAYQLQSRGTTRSIEESCQKWIEISLDNIQTVMNELTQKPQLAICVGTKSSIAPLGFIQAPIPQKFIFS